MPIVKYKHGAKSIIIFDLTRLWICLRRQMYTRKAIGYISENYSGDLNLKTVASKFAMSESYFSKQFKNVTGVGFNEYVNISRVSAAEKMLVKSNRAITEIAADCGFNDSNYFAAVFKKIKGITPKKYSSMNKKY